MSDTPDLSTYLPLLLICCMLPLLMGRGGQQQSQTPSTEMDIWFTSYTTQEAYDTVVKATNELREKAETAAKAKKSRFSFLRRGRKDRYTVDQTIPPNLHKIADGNDGLIQFEFSDAELGGTQVKTTFTRRYKSFIQNVKTTMPPRKLVAVNIPICPSCGRPKQPEWQVCPYDGSKYS